jgi:hypothetical protein
VCLISPRLAWFVGCLEYSGIYSDEYIGKTKLSLNDVPTDWTVIYHVDDFANASRTARSIKSHKVTPARAIQVVPAMCRIKGVFPQLPLMSKMVKKEVNDDEHDEKRYEEKKLKTIGFSGTQGVDYHVGLSNGKLTGSKIIEEVKAIRDKNNGNVAMYIGKPRSRGGVIPSYLMKVWRDILRKINIRLAVPTTTNLTTTREPDGQKSEEKVLWNALSVTVEKSGGKSTITQTLRDAGFEVIDSDDFVNDEGRKEYHKAVASALINRNDEEAALVYSEYTKKMVEYVKSIYNEEAYQSGKRFVIFYHSLQDMAAVPIAHTVKVMVGTTGNLERLQKRENPRDEILLFEYFNRSMTNLSPGAYCLSWPALLTQLGVSDPFTDPTLSLPINEA